MIMIYVKYADGSVGNISATDCKTQSEYDTATVSYFANKEVYKMVEVEKEYSIVDAD
jgi:hypothetical protein